jgi:predicted N-formylglutamate amidohydrolase
MSTYHDNKHLLFLSCEHGGNKIPHQFNQLFSSVTDVLSTHRGFDIGALELFGNLNSLKPTFAISSDISRLVVDLNRSLHRRSLFSQWTKPLSAEIKQEILTRYYFPFRNEFKNQLSRFIESNPVVHLSVHTFTPVLNGEIRQTDIGILYHPARQGEKDFAQIWKEEMHKLLPQMRVRFNYPYLGKPDGHVAYHRKQYSNEQYKGIELEVNQKHAHNTEVYTLIKQSFSSALNRFNDITSL